MNMQEHILAALFEQYTRWQEHLASLTSEQLETPLQPTNWSVKDEIAHLMAWQKRSIARLQAALIDHEPEFPNWIAGIDPDSEGFTDQINDWIYNTYRDRSWSQVHQEWRSGYLRFLELGAALSEKDLLDADRYTWLGGYNLALVLIASYDHHQEHLEILQSRNPVETKQ